MQSSDVKTPAQAIAARALDPRQWALLGLLASLGLYAFFYLPSGTWDYNFGYWIGRDFINFWAGGRLAWLGRSHLLFDTVAYNAWLKTQIAGDLSGGFIFSYPPLLVPLLIPFGLLPYGAALIAWTTVHIAAMVLAARALAGGRRQMLLVAAAPAVALASFQGHLTASLAALFCLTLSWRATRPVTAGIMLGLLTVKPQLGIVVGLIMLVEQRWQLMAVAAVTTLSLAAVSLAALGVEGWLGFAGSTLPQQKSFLTSFDGGFTYFLATPYASLRGLGLGHGAALAMHGAIALYLLWAVIGLWRDDQDRNRALLAAALVSVLVTPYANLYDLTLMVLPLTALLVRSSSEQAPVPTAGLLGLWLLPAIGLPLAMVAGPLAGLLLLGLTCLLLRASLATTGYRRVASA